MSASYKKQAVKRQLDRITITYEEWHVGSLYVRELRNQGETNMII